MRRKLPSSTALIAFEAAARHQSFTKAADELAVTQSAVCRQIAALEDFLGVALFRRNRRGVVLTDSGRRYSRSVAARLDDVERDTLDLMAQGSQDGPGGVVELAVVPTFATHWLMPRLAGFQARHPGITLHLSARTRPFLFADSGLDAAIHAGVGAWPGTEARLLMPEPMVAVASPALLQGRRIVQAEDLAGLPLLQSSTRPYAWRQWFDALGATVAHDLAGPRMELFSMLSEAAAQSLGLALVPRMLVERELADGRLVQVLPQAFLSDRRYHLLLPEHQPPTPALEAFAAWLVDEAALYRSQAGLG
jgi:LysR family glycine cleavage system transcriptional activator